MIITAILIVIPFWKIFERVGLSPYYALIGLIPGIGFAIVLAILAYSPWNTGKGGAL